MTRALFRLSLTVALATLVLASPVLAAATRSASDDQPRSAARMLPRRAAPARPVPVKPLVIQFQHIPAESFARTLKQLAENPRIDAMLRDMPKAVNEHANAIVVVAKPEAATFLKVLAEGLDQPNRFERRAVERDREQHEFRMKMDRMKHNLPGPPPQRPMAERFLGPKPAPREGQRERAGRSESHSRSESRSPVPDREKRGKRPASLAPADEPDVRFVLIQATGGGDRSQSDRDQRREEWRKAAQAAQAFRLLGDAEVRGQIGLGADQESAITEAIDKARKMVERIRDRVQLDYGGGGEGEDMDEEAMQARRREMWRAMMEQLREARPELKALMEQAIAALSEEQLTQLHEVGTTRMAYRNVAGDLANLNSRRAKEVLGLATEQMAQIKTILREAAEKFRKITEEIYAARTEGAEEVPVEERGARMRGLRDQLQAKREELRNETREKLLAVLTPEQQEKAKAFVAGPEGREPGTEGGRSLFGPGGGMPFGGPGGRMRGERGPGEGRRGGRDRGERGERGNGEDRGRNRDRGEAI